MGDSQLNEIFERNSPKKEEQSLGRVPPNDIDAERGLLGSILLSPPNLDSIIEIVKATDFYRPSHQELFNAFVTLRNMGKEIDSVSVRNYLHSIGTLDICGGSGYLIDIQSVGSSWNWKSYAEIVREKSIYRQIIAFGTKATAIGFDAAYGETGEAISTVLGMSTYLALNGTKDQKTADEILNNLIHEIKEGQREYICPKGVDIARMMKGDLVVAAAGTSVGKTAITLDWADEWSKTHKVTYFEYEMSEESLMSRLICKHAKVSMRQIQDRDMSPDEMDAVERAADELRTRQLSIEEVWCDVGTLMAKIRKSAKDGVEIVILDHLGLINFPRPKGMNEAKAIGVFVTNPLKRLAAELGIIIVLLVQFNREGQRDGGFPKLYHLRDSGEIEQDAAIVLLLWSERLIENEWGKRVTLREKSGIVDEADSLDSSFYLFRVGVEKNRNGKLDEVYCKYRGENFDFEYGKTNATSEIVERSMF